MQGFRQTVVRWTTLALASGCFISYLPVWLLPNRRATGAGLTGSVWGVLLLRGLPVTFWSGAAVWAGAVALSVAVSDAAEETMGRKDDQRIVIDEFVGTWTAVLFLPRSPFAVALAFLLFRLFDTWKPAGIRRLGDLPGGWGVVLDDLAAGAAANGCLRLLQLLHPL